MVMRALARTTAAEDDAFYFRFPLSGLGDALARLACEPSAAARR